MIFKRLQASPDIAKIYQTMMTEAVDAKINQRPYDRGPMYTQMMTVLFKHKELMFEGLKEQTDRTEQRYRSNIEAAYAAQGKKY